MKRKLSMTTGLCLMVTASAIGRSEVSDVIVEPVSVHHAKYGQVALESLTDEQRHALQAKYKYWRSSGLGAAKAPI
jgi:hypothetical protein